MSRASADFIWDFADKALRWPIPLGGGATYLAYGGDWGDNPNDGNFSGNGIVLAGREPTGKAVEVNCRPDRLDPPRAGAEESKAVVPELRSSS